MDERIHHGEGEGLAEAAVNSQIDVNAGRRTFFAGAGVALAAVVGHVMFSSSQATAQVRSASSTVNDSNAKFFNASIYGVTGINDGTRDDTPLLQSAYIAAVAAGAKCLVFPSGVVYLNTFSSDLDYPGYPYNYALRIQEDDFVVIVPEGCTVYCNTPGAGGDDNCVSAIQVTGKQGGTSIVSRSGVMGGGKFVHTYAGVTSSPPNNNWAAVYLTASTNDCFIDGLEANGFGATYVHAFDSSSSFRGKLSRLRAFNCYKAISQSSLQGTASHEIIDLKVVGYYCFGVTLSGPNNTLSSISIDNSNFNPINNSIALNAIGRLENLVGINIKLIGARKNNDQGLFMSPSIFNLTGKISLKNVLIEGFVSALVPQGLNNSPVIEGFEIKSGAYACWANSVSGSGLNNCGDVYLRDGSIDGFLYGLLAGASQSDESQGKYYLDNVKISNTSQPYWNTIPYIAVGNNVWPMPQMMQQIKYQRIPSAVIASARTGVDGLTTILTGLVNTILIPPSNPFDGQIWTLRSEDSIAFFSFSGVHVAGSPISLESGYCRTFVYSGAISTWV